MKTITNRSQRPNGLASPRAKGKSFPFHLVKRVFPEGVDFSLFPEMSEQLKESIWFLSSDRREIRLCGSSFERVWGKSPEEIFGRTGTYKPQDLADVLLPEDRQAFLLQLRSLSSEAVSIECWINRPDGEVRLIRSRARPAHNDQGEIVGYVMVSTDATEEQAFLSRESTPRNWPRAVSQVPSANGGMLTMCAWTKRVKYEGVWISLEDYLRQAFQVVVTHGISPEAAADLMHQADVLETRE